MKTKRRGQRQRREARRTMWSRFINVTKNATGFPGGLPRNAELWKNSQYTVTKYVWKQEDGRARPPVARPTG